jgi:hypothetical protein
MINSGGAHHKKIYMQTLSIARMILVSCCVDPCTVGHACGNSLYDRFGATCLAIGLDFFLSFFFFLSKSGFDESITLMGSFKLRCYHTKLKGKKKVN